MCVCVCVSVCVYVCEREREALVCSTETQGEQKRCGTHFYNGGTATTELKVCLNDPVLLACVNRRPNGMQARFIGQREGALLLFVTEICISNSNILPLS